MTARTILLRLYPWIGKAVHSRWRVRRGVYQQEAQDILLAFTRVNGHVPNTLALRLQGFLARLHGEWFPKDWRPHPTYTEVVGDFLWWLDLAESWARPPPSVLRRNPARSGAASPSPSSRLACSACCPSRKRSRSASSSRRGGGSSKQTTRT